MKYRLYAGIWQVISVEQNVKSVSVANTAGVTGRVTLFLTTGMLRFFAKLRLNSTSCGLLKIVCPEICFYFLIDWGLVKPQKVNLRNSKLIAHCKNLHYFQPYNFERQKLSIGPIFNNTFLATKLLQISQIYRLIRKKES